ncbi:hypothetical protein KIW84_011197 [Lathyrus oleraceus]|uniref:Mitochondrial protein n=1 Tax=Pisum sativum TaxID=3888 RepID=A0A9D4YNS0_PEA|nr:hypothetical protein KIW84_011197 [Pisum sativum]
MLKLSSHGGFVVWLSFLPLITKDLKAFGPINSPTHFEIFTPNYENTSHKRTPAHTHLKVSKDENGVSVDQSLYRSMIGSLLYLTASRHDIAFDVGVCARYQVEPKSSHINQVKRILKYVNGTSDYRMLYTHGSGSVLTGYCDADWAGSADDRKNT